MIHPKRTNLSTDDKSSDQEEPNHQIQNRSASPRIQRRSIYSMMVGRRRVPDKKMNCCTKPRKWTLSSILVLMLVVASISTLLINSVSVLIFSKQVIGNDAHLPLSMETVRRRKVHNIAYKTTAQSSRMVYLESSLQFYEAKQGRLIATMFPVEPVANMTNSSNFLNVSDAIDFELNMTAPDTILSRDEVTADNTQDQFSYLDRCLPKADWQTASFINCNAFHELNMAHSSLEHRRRDEEEQLSVLGEGWFRTAWRLQARNQTTVLKTLRIERDFLPEYYELHRRDAVAMERLTWSPFVVNVFGYCGNSAINEIADFPYRDVNDLEHFDRKMRYRERHPQIQRIKLQLAASIAQGVADIHSIDGPEVGVSMVHYDLNPRNIAIFAQGRPKINDFNIAEFLRYDPVNNRTCGFPNRMRQPWWRAPEEVNLTANVEVNEKTDIYSLGAILFHILTTHSPRGKMKKEMMEDVRADVVRGVAPVLPPPFDNMTDSVTMAFKKAMDRCFVVDHKERATADEIVDILFQALMKVLGDGSKKSKRRSIKHTDGKR